MNPDPLPPLRSPGEHPTLTAVFDKLMAEVEPVQAPPLAQAREELARLERMRSLSFPEGETLADDAVERQRRIVMQMESEAMQ